MNKTKKYIGTLALGAVILTAPGCSDAWDDHYNGNESGTGTAATETLWEQIESNPNLTRFAAIAKAARYYKDEAHPMKNNADGKDFTYDQLLDGSQLLTVWAPENDAFTEESYNLWMELAQSNGYSVQQQLMANSIALWRNNISTGRIDTLRMLNGKILIFDQGKQTMAGLPMNETNIAASNGTLHTTKELLPFNYNLYEYIKDGLNAKSNSINRFHEYVIKTDTTYFNENASLEGNPDENGYPTYVDSAYQTTNTMFFGTHRNSINNPENDLTAKESFGAYIESEDSSFVMLIPTDEAWEAAYQKLAPLYKYAPSYIDNEKANRGTASTREITAEMMDSVTRQSIDMDIISPLCFNVNLQPNAAGRKGTFTADKFIAEQGASCEYLLNTFGDTLRSDDSWEKSTIFDGKKIKMSNGYGVVASSWNIPAKLYKPDLNIEVGYQSFYRLSQNTADPSPVSYSFTNKTSWCDTTGVVSHNNFYYIYNGSTNGNPKTEFRLVGTDGENHESEVMSGKYDIKIVLVPNYYMTSNDSTIVLTVGTRGTGMVVNGDTIPMKHKLQATLSYNNGEVDSKGSKATSITSDIIEYDGTKVDTLTLFKDFVFPYSYKNLSHSYPTLLLTTKTSASERKNGYSNDYCIDRIILVSKDDNVATEAKKD